MRIMNNLTAKNTHRQYEISNGKVAKSAQKLASGYKVNSAADDAAGLAISEKMRTQIRGLNMAARNSQDAISLIQTAEGALQESHSILQRMNELAVQSATGTNQEFDRGALQKEFEQLKREINDVAESTTFNSMRILDGSMSYEGPQRSAQTSGINTMTITKDVNGSTIVTKESMTGVAEVAYVPGSFSAEFNDPKEEIPCNSQSQVDFNFKFGGEEYTLSLPGNSTSITSANQLSQMLRKALQNGNNAITTNSGQKVFVRGTLAKTFYASTNEMDVTGNVTAEHEVTADIDFSDLEISVSMNGTVYAHAQVTNTKNAEAGVPGVIGEHTYEMNADNLFFGDTITVGDKTYEVVRPGRQPMGKGNIAVPWDGATSESFITSFVNAAGKNSPSDVTVSADPDNPAQFVVKQKTAGVGDTRARYAADEFANTTTTIEFDTAKLRDGDIISISVGGVEYTHEFNKGDTPKTIISGLTDEEGNKLDIPAKGNALIIDGKRVETDIIPVEDPDFNAIRIQVGALEGEQTSLSIRAMNTMGLGMDDAKIDTQDNAGAAITATRNAINIVSDQRSTLGALQNRLEHKISNTKISSENLSAAESRIRDVDMAQEMTEFTKGNILSQAATAMLAQANALPQNVLSLLG